MPPPSESRPSIRDDGGGDARSLNAGACIRLLTRRNHRFSERLQVDRGDLDPATREERNDRLEDEIRDARDVGARRADQND